MKVTSGIILLFCFLFLSDDLHAQNTKSLIIDVSPTGDTTWIENVFGDTPGLRFVDKGPEPVFPGNLDKYIEKNIVYPKEALEKGVDGRVLLYCLIDTFGNVDSPIVLIGRNDLLDKEAIRIAKGMPKWKPAEFNGKKINMWWHIEIPFVLPSNKN